MIKRVLIYTYGDQSHKAAIQAAAAFASQHDAQISGLFVRPDYVGYSGFYGEYPLNLAKTFYDLQDDYAKRTQAEFETIVSSYDCRSQWHEIEQFEKKPKPSLYTDVIFISQPDSESNVIFNDTDFVDRLIIETGLPIIIVPKLWSSASFAQRPALGWKETREAAAAVRHALPLMRSAKQVDIVTVTKQSDLDQELVQGIGISEYLTEHGVKCQYFYERMIESEHNESETLIRHIENNKCDLIIIGGYGHSRFREIVLGGMTRELIKNSPVPVLMSH
ncbi:MAG: nucleotide-binding universal stress UspA family protein [Porticoccaceae bacterium]|jgi:nucleotide-binding universal stress UspA family protein